MIFSTATLTVCIHRNIVCGHTNDITTVHHVTTPTHVQYLNCAFRGSVVIAIRNHMDNIISKRDIVSQNKKLDLPITNIVQDIFNDPRCTKHKILKNNQSL